MNSSTSKKMQRKGNDKKLQWKKERERSDENWKLVVTANKLADPLASLVSFHNFVKNGLNIKLKCIQMGNLPNEILEWAFQLAKCNMQAIYEETWGWDDREKMEELKDDRMWYLLAYDDQEKPVAFSSFRFDLDFNEPVVYCYEIQLENSVQSKGLGTFMMQILQLLAIKNGLHKVMATVLNRNELSMKFFTEKLRYIEDESNLLDECYTILSKPVKKT